ncbi:translation initiation factor 2 [Paenibacillus sp. NPDC058071]|uniref:translation initiation factor 2 n=1 Tax=Paenibacillus sp. NPDC058071 TaxID=3346326 RepID=UPI0036DA514F
MDPNQTDFELADIQIARLAFIGASIATLGDGIAAVAAGLALESLEIQKIQSDQRSYFQSNPSQQLESTQKQLDYFIQELIKLRTHIR